MKTRVRWLVVAVLAGAALFLTLRSRRGLPGEASHAGTLFPDARLGSGAPPPLRAPPTAPDGASPVEGGGIEVQVQSATGPVAGAEVRLYLRGAGALPQWQLSGTRSSGSDGRARLPASPGVYFVSARQAPWALAHAEFVRAAGEKVTRVLLSLEAASSVRGRVVVRGSSEPVPLARVSVAPAVGPADRPAAPETPEDERRQVVADGQGRFVVDGLAKGLYDLEASAPGHARAAVRASPVPRPDEVVLQMGASSFVEGHVVDRKGAPVRAAKVMALGGATPAATLTSETGAFSLEVLPGVYRLAAWSGADSAASPAPVVVREGLTVRDLRLQLGPSGTLGGRVVAKNDGRSIPGAQIAVLTSAEETPAARAEAGPDGRFTIVGLPPGIYEIKAVARGFVELLRDGVVLEPASSFDLRLELAQAGAVAGHVTGKGGRPEAAVLVRAGDRFATMTFAATQGETRTDEKGEYRLEGLVPGRLRVAALRPGSAVGVSQEVEVPAGGTAIADFTVPSTGRLGGHVTRLDGGPLTHPARVSARGTSGELARSDPGAVAVDEAGDYAFELPAGEYSVRARSLDKSIGKTAVQVTVAEGQTTRADLTVDENMGPEVVCSIVEPGGAPAAGAWAMLYANAGAGGNRIARRLTADDDGKVKLAAWADLPQELDLRAVGRAGSGLARLTPPATEPVLQLQPGGRIRGHLASSGKPASGFTLSWSIRIDSDLIPRPDLEFSGDRFELDEVPAGRVVLKVQTSDGRSGSTEVAVESGATVAAEIPLTGSASVVGRLVDAVSRQPIPGFVSIDGMGSNDGEVRAEGRFRLAEVPAGAHKFAAAVAGLSHQRVERDIAVRAGETLDLGDVALPRRSAPPGTIGVQVNQITADVVAIGYVFPGWPADLAGLASGDQLVAIDGAAVRTVADAKRGLDGAPGSTVTVQVRRNGEVKTFAVARAPAASQRRELAQMGLHR